MHPSAKRPQPWGEFVLANSSVRAAAHRDEFVRLAQDAAAALANWLDAQTAGSPR